METDKTLNETKQWLAEQGYGETANNSFGNKHGENVEADGKWVRKEGHGTWRNSQDEDTKL